MVSRNFIRIKVMRALYACQIREQYNSAAVQNLLRQTFNDMFVLFLKLNGLFGVLTLTARNIVETRKQKLLPTQEDLNPNLKFINNQFVRKLEQNAVLQQEWTRNNLLWTNDIDMLSARKIFDQLIQTELYKQYMSTQESSFKTDKQFVLDMVEHFLPDNEDAFAYFSEQKAEWVHDFDYVTVLVYKFLSGINEKQSEDKPLPPIFKVTEDSISEDEIFMRELAAKTVKNNAPYTQLISGMLQNWEIDRVAILDTILLKMAICEFCEFPSIPIRVTMNEYIDMARYYSTHKSPKFINGLLDRIQTELKEKDQIHKQGRGLMGGKNE